MSLASWRLGGFLFFLAAIEALIIIIAPLASSEKRWDLASAPRRHLDGHAAIAEFPRFGLVRFDADAVLLEDGAPLALPEAAHADIAALGSGRYSAWAGRTVLWSSSDGSDPIANGRRYELVFFPDVLRSPLVVLLFIAIAALALVLGDARPRDRRLRIALAIVTFLAFEASSARRWNAIVTAPDTGSYLAHAPERSALYPAFLDLFDSDREQVLSDAAIRARFLNAIRAQKFLLALAVTLLVFVVAGAIDPWLVGLLALGFAILDPMLGTVRDAAISWNVETLLSEGLNHALVFFFFAAAFARAMRASAARSALVGIATALLLLNRPANAPCVLVLALVLACDRARGASWKRALLDAGAIALVALLPVLAAMAANARDGGRFRLHAFSGPSLLCTSLATADEDDARACVDPREREFLELCVNDPKRPDPRTDPRWVDTWLYKIARPAFARAFRDRAGDAWARDDVFGAIARRLIARHPRAWLGLVAMNLARAFDPLIHLMVAAAIALAVVFFRRTRSPLFLFAIFLAALPIVATLPVCVANAPLERYRSQLLFAEVLALPFALAAIAGGTQPEARERGTTDRRGAKHR